MIIFKSNTSVLFYRFNLQKDYDHFYLLIIGENSDNQYCFNSYNWRREDTPSFDSKKTLDPEEARDYFNCVLKKRKEQGYIIISQDEKVFNNATKMRRRCNKNL